MMQSGVTFTTGPATILGAVLLAPQAHSVPFSPGSMFRWFA